MDAASPKINLTYITAESLAAVIKSQEGRNSSLVIDVRGDVSLYSFFATQCRSLACHRSSLIGQHPETSDGSTKLINM